MPLKSLGDADEAVVALAGDVKNSTYTEYFAEAHPDRYFEGRIAEQAAERFARPEQATDRRPEDRLESLPAI